VTIADPLGEGARFDRKRGEAVRLRRSIVAVVALALFALVGCSSNSDGTSDGTSTETQGEGGGEVAVTLDDYAIRPEAATLPAGEVSFKIENVGATEHEMVVIRSDIDPATIPVEDHEIDEEAPGMTPIGEVEDVQPSASKDLVLTLEPGNYILVCNLPKHFERGMVTTITVA
jgi:uncharacterized cupredoxin-like copper-binding protein